MSPIHPELTADREMWQRLLSKARDLAEQIEGQIRGVISKHGPNGGHVAAQPEGRIEREGLDDEWPPL